MTCFPLQFSRLARTSIRRSVALVRSGPPLETAIAPLRERRKDRQRRRQSSLSVMTAGDQACPETRPCPHPSSGSRKPTRTLVEKADDTDVLLANVESQHRHAAQLFWITCCSGRRQISKTSCSISGSTLTTIARIPHGKGERRKRPCHDQSQISTRLDGSPIVDPYFRPQWLPNFSVCTCWCAPASCQTRCRAT